MMLYACMFMDHLSVMRTTILRLVLRYEIMLRPSSLNFGENLMIAMNDIELGVIRSFVAIGMPFNVCFEI